MSVTDTPNQAADAPSQEDFDVAALCLESDGRRLWHIHPEDSAAVLRVAEWTKSRITIKAVTDD